MNNISFILVICLTCFGCKINENSNKDAFVQAISFEATPKEIQKYYKMIKTISVHEIQTLTYNELGTNNLSSFLITVNPNKMKEYECEFNADNYIVVDHRLPFGKSLVQYKDLSDITMIKTNSMWIGSFKYNVKNAFIGECFYELKKVNDSFVITKLMVKKKMTSDMKDGYCIFEK